MKSLPHYLEGLSKIWSNFCLEVEFPGYETFVSHQNIKHLDSNLAQNHHFSGKLEEKLENFAQNFLFSNFAP